MNTGKWETVLGKKLHEFRPGGVRGTRGDLRPRPRSDGVDGEGCSAFLSTIPYTFREKCSTSYSENE